VLGSQTREGLQEIAGPFLLSCSENPFLEIQLALADPTTYPFSKRVSLNFKKGG
jgi:hypothetical protein